MLEVDHLDEARIRADWIETTEAQLALGLLESSPEIHSGLAAVAQGVVQHLWIFSEEQVMA